ncbi:class I SAM-dependent methyltransferase [Methanocaldococcus indicus]|uniref:class I SAM-dependent methyltransferase n=1 Tax=Methanocaldococcus indicus TaxID=213231 RepID=UPI003C6D995B
MKIIKYYDALAKKYNELYNLNYMEDVERKIMSKYIKEDDLVLDIGCGTGRHLKYFKKAIGLDISLEMAKIAKKYNPVVVGNVEYLPFKNNSFDAVISFFGALNHCNIIRAFKEIRRVLKNDGIFIFTLANVYDIFWIIKNLKKPKKIFSAIKKRKGEIYKVINNKKYNVKTRFYSYKEIIKLLNKLNFKLEFSFGLSNIFLDKFFYNTPYKYISTYIGFVVRK